MKIQIAAMAVAILGLGQSVSAELRARISMHEARARALTMISGGRIRSAKLEYEHGVLVYSFDIVRPDRRGVDEVLINSRTGQIVIHNHETPAMERREARADASRRTRH